MLKVLLLVLINCFKFCNQSTVSQKIFLRETLFTLLFVQLLNIYFFSKSFLLPFNQFLGVLYLILGAGPVVKGSCCQVILYILYFLFKHFFSCCKVEFSQYFPINSFHIRLHKRWKICISLSRYFSFLKRSDMVLKSDLNFSFVTRTPCSMCFPVDVETTHSCLFLHFSIWWTGEPNFSDCFSWSFLKVEDLQLSTLYILVFFFFKTRKSMDMSILASKKENLFSRVKGCFIIINVAHTKTLVFSFLLNEIGWFKNNRQIYLLYIYIYIYQTIYNLVSLW